MTQDTNKFKYVIGTVVLTAFLMVVWALCFKTIPKENEQVFYIVVGMISANVATMMNYHFGSSSGSKDKSQLIEDMTRKKTP